MSETRDNYERTVRKVETAESNLKKFVQRSQKQSNIIFFSLLLDFKIDQIVLPSKISTIAIVNSKRLATNANKLDPLLVIFTLLKPTASLVKNTP